MNNNPSQTFNEDDIKRILSGEEGHTSSEIEIEFQPEDIGTKSSPVAPSMPVKPVFQAQSPKLATPILPKSAPSPTSASLSSPRPNVKTNVYPSFHSKPPSRIKSFLRYFFKYLILFVLIFIIAFTITNYQSIILQMRYFWSNQVQKPSVTSPSQTTSPVITVQNRLVIPKISVDAPIVWNVDPSNINPALQNGVAQYKGTALPGNFGNVFIFGHSSYYAWAPGNYKTVFALLGNLNIGDKIYIEYNNTKYNYIVSSMKTVWPTNAQVLNQTTDKELTLMTCVPVGTNLQRLIVVANQIE